MSLQSDYTKMYIMLSEANKLFKYFKQINKSLIFGNENKIYFRLSIFINTSAIILKLIGGKQSLDSLHFSLLTQTIQHCRENIDNVLATKMTSENKQRRDSIGN